MNSTPNTTREDEFAVACNRPALLQSLYHRQRTVSHVFDKVVLLSALARAYGYAAGTPVEVDGDALAILRRGGAL
jgi:hypothetical protein